MRTTYLAIGVGAFLAAAILIDYLKPDATPPLPPAGPIPLACARECLESVIDQYLEALVTKDTSDLPLSEDLRVSENNQMLDFGDGYWKTATGRGSYSHYFADPILGQIAFMGTMEEGDTRVLMALRLRIELGRTTEVEASTLRIPDDDPIFDDLVEPERVWFEAIPTSERLSRPEIIAVANAYFEALQAGLLQSSRLFTPDCYKVANGAAMSCVEESPDVGKLTTVHERRFPLVDAERGVVWAYSVRDHDPSPPAESPNLESGVPVAALYSQSFQAVEAFLIEGGLIRRMETILFPVPFHSNSPWDGGLGGR